MILRGKASASRASVSVPCILPRLLYPPCSGCSTHPAPAALPTAHAQVRGEASASRAQLAELERLKVSTQQQLCNLLNYNPCC